MAHRDSTVLEDEAEHRRQLRQTFERIEARQAVGDYLASGDYVIDRIRGTNDLYVAFYLPRAAPQIDAEPRALTRTNVEVSSADSSRQGQTEPDYTIGDTPVSLVIFRPTDLLQGDAFHSIVGSAKRSIVTTTWDSLCKALAHSVEGEPWLVPERAKRAAGAVVPGTFHGAHGHGELAREFVSTSVLIADVDGGDPHAVARALASYATCIHTTYRHRPDAGRCRVYLLLSREVTNADEYNLVLRCIALYLTSRGFVCHAKDSTLGKLAYCPMHTPGVPPIHVVTHGSRVNVDRILAVAARLPGPSKVSCAPSVSSAAYAAKAIANEVERTATAAEGSRHTQLYASAAALARPQLGLAPNRILDALLPAAQHADPDEDRRELERTIRDGIHAGRGDA